MLDRSEPVVKLNTPKAGVGAARITFLEKGAFQLALAWANRLANPKNKPLAQLSREGSCCLGTVSLPENNGSHLILFRSPSDIGSRKAVNAQS